MQWCVAFVLSGVVCLLAACKQEVTVSYLLQHPSVLERELTFCTSERIKSENQTKHCSVTLKAGDVIRRLVYAQRADPESFGERILRLQMSMGDLVTTLWHQKAQIDQLIQTGANEAVLTAAKDKYATMKQQYYGMREQLIMYMAVMGLNTPE